MSIGRQENQHTENCGLIGQHIGLGIIYDVVGEEYIVTQQIDQNSQRTVLLRFCYNYAIHGVCNYGSKCRHPHSYEHQSVETMAKGIDLLISKVNLLLDKVENLEAEVKEIKNDTTKIPCYPEGRMKEEDYSRNKKPGRTYESKHSASGTNNQASSKWGERGRGRRRSKSSERARGEISKQTTSLMYRISNFRPDPNVYNPSLHHK